MGIALSDDVKQLVDRPNFAHLATIMSDGSPHSAPFWIGRENDLLLVCTEAGSLLTPTRKSKFVDALSSRVPILNSVTYDAMSEKYTGNLGHTSTTNRLSFCSSRSRRHAFQNSPSNIRPQAPTS